MNEQHTDTLAEIACEAQRKVRSARGTHTIQWMHKTETAKECWRRVVRTFHANGVWNGEVAWAAFMDLSATAILDGTGWKNVPPELQRQWTLVAQTLYYADACLRP